MSNFITETTTENGERNMEYDVIIVITPKDYVRVRNNFERILKLSKAGRIIFVGSAEVGELMAKETWKDRASFVNEDDILPFENVRAVFKILLGVDDVPRGLVGWYYQQFLKMQYAFCSKNRYYLTWDGDTVPTKEFSMFKEGTETPFFDMKYENHEEYFVTMKKLLGYGKVVKKSFISEHMIFDREIMKELIGKIEKADIPGNCFYEKILRVVRPEALQSNSFSEFETYGTFVCMEHPSSYVMKDWHSIRYGSIYFHPDEMTDEDYEWISKDFDAVSFEKNQEYNPDIAVFFKDMNYRGKLSARQIVEAIQDSSDEGLREEWEDGVTPDYSGDDIDETLDVSDGDEFLFFNYLGDNLVRGNPDQAFLCYENAEFLCPDPNVKAVLKQKKEQLFESGRVRVNKASIVIVSYNGKEFMKNCISSIKRYCAPGAYSVVVVDNASDDGVAEWLEKREDITLIRNNENVGFPKGCNIGIAASDERDDIFLLNNDTRLTHNALFFLRMGLYSSDDVGACGGVSNYCGKDQRIDIKRNLPCEYEEYARQGNCFMQKPYEEKNRLSGFAMLMKREAFEKTGGLDEAFSPGFFEDDDISLSIRSFGYRLLICHNSFIYHAGSQGFNKREDIDSIFERNCKLLAGKWDYDTAGYAMVSEKELKTLDEMPREKNRKFTVLEIGSGSGNFLTKIQYEYPLSNVFGAEKEEKAIKNGVSGVTNLLLDWEKDAMPFAEGVFDYIIFNDRFSEGYSTKFVEERLSLLLKKNGKIIFAE